MTHRFAAYSLVAVLVSILAAIGWFVTGDGKRMTEDRVPPKEDSGQGALAEKQPDAASDRKRKEFVQAMDVALKAVSVHHPLGNRRFSVSIHDDPDGWFLCITFLPETPGDELLVTVKRNGEAVVVPGM